MKRLFKVILLFVLIHTKCIAQEDSSSTNEEVIQLMQQLASAANDTSRILIMAELSYSYAYADFDSSFLYGQQSLKQANEMNFIRGKANALVGLGNLYLRQGDYPKGLQYQLQALQVCVDNHFEREKAASLMEIGYTYQYLSDNTKALIFFKRAKEIFDLGSVDENKRVENEIGLSNIYMRTNQKDSALATLVRLYNDPRAQQMFMVTNQALCDFYIMMQNYPKALEHFYIAIDLDLKKNDIYSLIWAYNSGAKVFENTLQVDSCIYYAKKGLSWAQKIKLNAGILLHSLKLSERYEATNIREAFYYRKIFDDVYQKLYGSDKVLALQKTLTEDLERQRQAETARVAEENKRRQYLFAIGLAILVIIASLLYRNNLQQRKAKNIVDEKNKAIEQTLNHLRATQAQLIQSEKMASLGQLTSGIAHEIQNPLNFVNNFSEVSGELIDEAEDKRHEAGENSPEVHELLKDIKDNLSKINHHGKRADGIVKSMMLHSRPGSDRKEPTDINALADKYLRLVYHGLRSKDNTLHVDIHTDFDPSIGEIEVINEDISRVLLNVLSNAFYAVHARSTQISANSADGENGPDNYEPAVFLSTQKSGNNISIKIRDNGNGIPEKIVGKIFQPFFTTKPSGQGTGLGLSLAYDAVKAHGGEIRIVNTPGEGVEFIVILPINS